jgi:hypothetical protein
MLVAALFVRARDGRRGAEATRTPRALPGSCGQSGAGRKKRGDNPPPSRRGRNSCPVASVDFHAAGDRAARCSDVNRPQASAGSTSARYSSGVAPIRDNIATIACEATAREGHNAGLDKPLDGELSAVTRSRGRRRIRCREGESNPHAHEGAPRSERGVSAIPPPRHSAACARESEATILSTRRESNPHTTMGTSTSSWRVCHSTTGRCRECGAEGSNLSPCGPRFYGPPAGTTRFHTARCREHKLRFNSEGAAATGGSGTW